MICVINCGTSWLEGIKSALDCENHTFKVVEQKDISSYDFTPFSGIIITGGPTLLTEYNLDKFLPPFNFIKEIKLPVLGICLGHQILGLLYGAEIKRGEKVYKQEKIEIIKESDLFQGIKNNSEFREEHLEYISLPGDFELIAKSNSCGNEAMKLKGQNKYGVQFHPEESGENGRQIFKNFLELTRA